MSVNEKTLKEHADYVLHVMSCHPDFWGDHYQESYDFWTKIKNDEISETIKTNRQEITEKGKAIIKWMQENCELRNNIFTAKTIGEGLFISGRSVSSSIQKLIKDGYVSKQCGNPIAYSLTDSGKNLKI